MLRSLAVATLITFSFTLAAHAQKGQITYENGKTWAFTCLLDHSGVGDTFNCAANRNALAFWYSNDTTALLGSGGLGGGKGDPQKVRTVPAKDVAEIVFDNPSIPTGFVPGEEWRRSGCSGRPTYYYNSCEVRKAVITLVNGQKISDVYIRFHGISYLGYGVVGAKGNDDNGTHYFNGKADKEHQHFNDLSIQKITFQGP